MVTAVIAEDHALVREGIVALIQGTNEFKILGQASDGQEAVRLVLELKPDILLIDLSMPRLNGIDALQQLNAARSETNVLVVSMHADEAIVLRALRAGAKGYLLKDSFKEELFLAMRSAVRGQIYLSPRLTDLVLNNMIQERTRTSPLNPIDRLSNREREVLQLILEGNTNRQMSDVLKISIKTVDKHRTNLMRKLNVHDVSGLVHTAVKNGMLYVR